MPIEVKRSLKQIILLTFSLVIISGSVVITFSLLGNVCSQVIHHIVYFYNAMLEQQLVIP